MKPSAWLIGGLAGLAVVGYLGRYQVTSALVSQQDALANHNVQAFLAMLRGPFEGGGRYDTLYHPSHNDPLYDPSAPLYFDGYDSHPDIKIYFTNPKTGQADYTTAAGAYQILYRTWKGLTLLPGAPQDFSPASQDWFAVALLKAAGALAPLMAGDLDSALRKASPVWASLPYTDSGQVHGSYATAKRVYLAGGGTIAGAIA